MYKKNKSRDECDTMLMKIKEKEWNLQAELRTLEAAQKTIKKNKKRALKRGY